MMTRPSWQAREAPAASAIRAVVVLGVLVGAVLLGAVAATGVVEPLYFAAAAVVPVGGWLVLRHGQGGLGVLAILAAGGLLGIVTIPTGTASEIVVSLVLTLGLLVLWLLRLLMVRVSGEKLLATPINKPILVFILVQVVSFGWSTAMRDPLIEVDNSFLLVQTAALVVTCALPLLSLYVVNVVDSVRIWRWAVWLTIAIALLHLGSAALNLPTAMLTTNGTRGLFAMWAGGFALALLLYDRTLSVWAQWLLLVLLGALTWYYIMANTSWLSGWLPMVMAWAVVVFMRSKKLFALMMVVVIIVLAANYTLIYDNVVVSNTEEGGTERLDLWRMNLEHVRAHPLLGMGPAGYAPYNMTYHPEDARSTHNNYFDILAQSGIVGAAAFLFMIWRFGKVGLQNVIRLHSEEPQRRENDFARAFASATLGGGAGALAGMMLGDWVLPFAYNQTITGFDNSLFTWIFLGGMVSLSVLTAAVPSAGPAQEVGSVAAAGPLQEAAPYAAPPVGAAEAPYGD